MKKLNPYLNFGGTCLEALHFYKDCLNGEIVSTQTFGEANMPVDDSYKHKILHAEFKAGDINFFAADGMPDFVPVPGNMVTMTINLDDPIEEERIFNALASGGKIVMPLDKTFWGAVFGMLNDRYGITWMLNCEVKEQ